MRTIRKLLKISILTFILYSVLITYELFDDFSFMKQEVELDDLISTKYEIKFTDTKKLIPDELINNAIRENVSPERDVKAIPAKPTEQEIKDRYKYAIDNLYEQAQLKINDLMQAAYDEYTTRQEKGEEISYFYFFKKYNSAANGLEKVTDEAFYNLYDSFVEELKQYGYDVTIANEFLTSYEAKKKAIRTTIMKEAASKF